MTQALYAHMNNKRKTKEESNRVKQHHRSIDLAEIYRIFHQKAMNTHFSQQLMKCPPNKTR
jgi:hypothetical protein